MQRVVQYENPICCFSSYKIEEYAELDKKFEVIEANFPSIEFSCQKYEDKKLIGEYVYKLPKCILKKATVYLDMALDEFNIELSEPITVQTFDGIARQSYNLQLEVVTEEFAQANDNDFIGALKLNDLIVKDEYKLGEINSYYKTLGTLDGTTYYYREL